MVSKRLNMPQFSQGNIIVSKFNPQLKCLVIPFIGSGWEGRERKRKKWEQVASGNHMVQRSGSWSGRDFPAFHLNSLPSSSHRRRRVELVFRWNDDDCILTEAVEGVTGTQLLVVTRKIRETKNPKGATSERSVEKDPLESRRRQTNLSSSLSLWSNQDPRKSGGWRERIHNPLERLEANQPYSSFAESQK